jgi:hypothetical protein
VGITYENQRVHFDLIVKKYKDYIALYRLFNNGSVQGITTFGDFYWRMTYLSKYQDGKQVGSQGY